MRHVTALIGGKDFTPDTMARLLCLEIGRYEKRDVRRVYGTFKNKV